jgi:O-antigen/teichoic acid export membrane protein
MIVPNSFTKSEAKYSCYNQAMSTRRAGSAAIYGICILFGLLGVGLCCFFGFGEVSSPSVYSLSFIVIAMLMILLAAFGYRGLREHRQLGNEVWWQLLIIGLISVGFLAFALLFVFICLALLSGGQTTF